MATKRRRKGPAVAGETTGRLKGQGEEVADTKPSSSNSDSPDAVDDVVQKVSDKARQQKRWTRELEAAKKEKEKFDKDSEGVLKRFRGTDETLTARRKGKRNYFAANIQTQEAVLYGETPKISVERKFNDAKDDVARVGCAILERLANADIHRANDEYASAVGLSLWDYIGPGLGMARLHYRCDEETVPAVPAKKGVDAQTGDEVETAPAVEAYQKKSNEDVETEYVNWRDILWSAGARHWGDVRWVAFRVRMTKAQREKAFGKGVAETVTLNAKKADAVGGGDADSARNDPRDIAELWEVHDKENRKLFFVQEGADAVLKVQADPWELESFFTFGKPMLANLTTDSCIPESDYELTGKELYDELDYVSMRMARLVMVMKAVGVYDQTNPSIKRLMTEAVDNDLLPAENWPAFMEKGGLTALISMFPLEAFVSTLEALAQRKADLKQEMFELTGMSDLVRGEGDPNETATAQGIKAKFASVRLNRRVKEFARFCTDLARVKLEMIAKLFEAQTIIERSNILRTEDGQPPLLPAQPGQPQATAPEGTIPPIVQEAVQLIQSDFSGFRIEVKPESVSLDDFVERRAEATEVLGALGQLVQTFGPLMQMSPAAGPLLQGFIQYLLSNVKGGKDIEAYVDETFDAIKKQQQAAAAQPPQPPPPDPKLQAAQTKAQGDVVKEKVKTQGQLQTIQAQSQADLQHQVQQTHFNVVEAAAKERMKVDAQIDDVLTPHGSEA